MSKRAQVIALVLAGSLGFSAAARAVDPPPPKAFIKEAPPFEGRTAGEWIKALQQAPEAESRSKAAEALGFMARETKQTYGGFSDVPIDTPEPPKLTPEALAPIVAALSAGLSDSNARVRASCAVALAWTGTRAKGAVPALLHVLDDSDETTRRNALRAIGDIGPTKDETPARLKRLLATAAGMERVHVAEAMRKTGVEPEAYVPTLIACLACLAQKESHYAAMELGQLGDPAVPALVAALADQDSNRRGNAAYALGNMAGWEKLTEIVRQWHWR